MRHLLPFPTLDSLLPLHSQRNLCAATFITGEQHCSSSEENNTIFFFLVYFRYSSLSFHFFSPSSSPSLGLFLSPFHVPHPIMNHLLIAQNPQINIPNQAIRNPRSQNRQIPNTMALFDNSYLYEIDLF